MILYFIRHGETTFNLEGRIQGQLDTPLSELGRQQAQALVAAFHDLPIDAIYSSPLSRASDTAQPVAEDLGLALKIDPRLMELDAGVFQGLRSAELGEKFPDAIQKWRGQDPDFRIPGGESRRDLMQRGRAVMEDIFAQGHKQAVVVSHGGLLAAALKALLQVPAERNPFVLYNGSISSLAVSSQIKLLTLNQMEHLRAAGCMLETKTGELS